MRVVSQSGSVAVLAVARKSNARSAKFLAHELISVNLISGFAPSSFSLFLRRLQTLSLCLRSTCLYLGSSSRAFQGQFLQLHLGRTWSHLCSGAKDVRGPYFPQQVLHRECLSGSFHPASSANKSSLIVSSRTFVLAFRRAALNSFPLLLVCRRIPSFTFWKACLNIAPKKIPNRVGARTQPCLTPLRMSKAVDEAVST